MAKNILFLFTDQQRADTLGCYGNSVCRTPNIDRLASEGVLFERAYTPTSICTPARASVVTGLKPSKHGLIANYERNVCYPVEMDPSHVPFSRELREADYEVGHVGKWHVGKDRPPAEFGFDGEHYPGWGETVHHPAYVRYLEERGYPPFRVEDVIQGTFDNGKPGNMMGGLLKQPVEATFSYFLAEEAIGKLKRYGKRYREEGKPFYLGLHFFGPHMPYFLPEEYANLYDPDDVELPPSFGETFEGKPQVQYNYYRHWCYSSYTERQVRKLIAMYWGFTTLIDEQIGRVMEALRELGLADDTMIAFTTDHGSFEGHHKLYDKGPAMYEDTYRVPLIAKYPGAPGGGKSESRLVSLLDLTATFVDEATGEVPERYDGQSLLPLLKDGPGWREREEMFAEFHGHHFPYPQRMIRTERYKLVVNPPDVNEFYDLEADPWEMRNLIDEPSLQETIADHYRRLFAYLKENGDNFYHWMFTMYPVGEDIVNESAKPYTKQV